jgi:ABC-type uncharacterized transport system permease subunit
MILSTASFSSSVAQAPGGLWWVLVAALLYALAVLGLLKPLSALRRFSAPALWAAWVVHAVLLVMDIGGVGLPGPGARLGFAPVLSLTVWLVIAVYGVESRLVPLPAVRPWLALAGMLAVLVGATFPGELRPISSPLAPLHFVLGVGAYALFGAAVLHALLLDASERGMRGGGLKPSATRINAPAAGAPRGLPLLQLERLTFRFVEAGFVALTGTLLLGLASTVHWRWNDHKAVFSLLAWGVFAALLAGRYLRGWRGRHATRWLYAGALLLLLAYVGSRFVFEVLLGRSPV